MLPQYHTMVVVHLSVDASKFNILFTAVYPRYFDHSATVPAVTVEADWSLYV